MPDINLHASKYLLDSLNHYFSLKFFVLLARIFFPGFSSIWFGEFTLSSLLFSHSVLPIEIKYIKVPVFHLGILFFM